ncbi:zf-TFIIB domain-containing protein, partial [Chloroflexota bacterium]
MICPVCKQDMLVVEHQNIELDYCASCHGVWFDSGELELLLQCHGFEEAAVFLAGILAKPVATGEKPRKCPICSRKMAKASVGETIIDACSRGEGLWFDGGELTQTVKHLA